MQHIHWLWWWWQVGVSCQFLECLQSSCGKGTRNCVKRGLQRSLKAQNESQVHHLPLSGVNVFFFVSYMEWKFWIISEHRGKNQRWFIYLEQCWAEFIVPTAGRGLPWHLGMRPVPMLELDNVRESHASVKGLPVSVGSSEETEGHPPRVHC